MHQRPISHIPPLDRMHHARSYITHAREARALQSVETYTQNVHEIMRHMTGSRIMQENDVIALCRESELSTQEAAMVLVLLRTDMEMNRRRMERVPPSGGRSRSRSRPRD